MMLRALVELATREGLVESDDFEKKRVDFEIQIDDDGRFVGLISLQGEDGKGQRMSVPRFPSRTMQVVPGFMVDNAKYVLGIGDPKKDKSERLAKCQAAFIGLIKDAFTATKDPGLSALLAFYERIADNLASVLRDRSADKWSGSEILFFSDPTLGRLHDRPAIREYWAAFRNAETNDGGSTERARCLVTGRYDVIERLHPMLKRVPGGQSSGAAVVSFNADAFESHHLSQGDNAPVCRSAAIAYTTALNWLLEKVDDRPHRHGVRIGDDAVALYWTTAPDKALSFFADLWEGPRKEEAERFFESPWKGQPPADLDQNRFYAVTLGGNAARVVVRDWFETSIGKVKENLSQYCDDLAIGAVRRPFAIWQLLAAIDPPGKATAPPDMGARVFAASLKGTPLPRELLRHALLRMRVPGKKAEAFWVLGARVALIKATLLGIGRTDQNKTHLKEVTVSLDSNSNLTAYNLGRLFAALERAQQNALGDVNSTIRDRYFSAATMTPALVFPRLLRMAQHHIAKAKAENREYGIERTVTEIVGRLPATGLPSLLTLEDQGLFAVGYYHQREAFFTKRKTSNPPAASAAGEE